LGALTLTIPRPSLSGDGQTTWTYAGIVIPPTESTRFFGQWLYVRIREPEMEVVAQSSAAYDLAVLGYLVGRGIINLIEVNYGPLLLYRWIGLDHFLRHAMVNTLQDRTVLRTMYADWTMLQPDFRLPDGKPPARHLYWHEVEPLMDYMRNAGIVIPGVSRTAAFDLPKPRFEPARDYTESESE
jgi:hypothetical protein